MKAVDAILPDLKLALVAVLVSLFLLGSPAKMAAKQKLFEAYKQVIVLDPGHGGSDPGARGPNGIREKDVVLTLARILATELEGQYHVVLTRTDDYQVDINTRTAQANHLKADLFISLHTAGSFVHRTAGATIFFYQDFPRSSGGGPAAPEPGSHKPDAPRLWQGLQKRHIGASRLLARLINSRLNSVGNTPQSTIQGAPLAVLQGADMPAVLIEPGYLTNPAEEEKLRDRQYLMTLATAIRRGIEDFLARNSP
jgi:N-acetylmuramoyl-L-alanine amidase